MTEIEIRQHAVTLARVLAGKVRSKRGGFLADPYCPFEVRGSVSGVRVTVWMGLAGGLAVFDHYQSAKPFQFSFFRPEPKLGLTEEITSLVGSPARVFSNTAQLYLPAIRELFPSWKTWEPSLEQLRRLNKSVTIAAAQSQWAFSPENIGNLEPLIKDFAWHLSNEPFEVIEKKIQSRYSDKPYVKLDPAKVAPAIRHLLPLAAQWSIVDESELRAYAASVAVESRDAFMSNFRSNMPEIESFCRVVDTREAVSDEVVAFQLAAHAFGMLAANSGKK